jgi:molybdopterin-guanine dinucleotide biosynthesis protein A
MGTEKAALRIGGETLLARVLRRLQLALSAVVIIGPPDLTALASGVPIYPDEIPGVGPLGGISTAFAHLASQRIFVVGCDMPFVAPALVKAITRYAARYPTMDVVTLRTARGIEPLHAVYARSCWPRIQERLAAADGRSLGALLSQLRVKEVSASVVARHDPAGRSTFNANSPEDWQEALAIQAQESSASAS